MVIQVLYQDRLLSGLWLSSQSRFAGKKYSLTWRLWSVLAQVFGHTFGHGFHEAMIPLGQGLEGSRGLVALWNAHAGIGAIK